MYNVTVGPSKVVTKSRRGMNQNVERLENNRDQDRKAHEEGRLRNVDNSPRPVFHTSHKKGGNNRPSQAMSPEHERTVLFLTEYWTETIEDYEKHVENQTTGPTTVVYYEEKTPNKLLEDFKPFDLEAWWGRRLFNTLTKNV